MATQRLTEWLNRSPAELEYFRAQFAQPYQSTIAFSKWLARNGCFPQDGSTILDLGAGMGETLAYLAPRFQQTSFVGVEINPQLVSEGNQRLRSLNVSNAKLEKGNLYRLPGKYRKRFQGIVSVQTLSWLPDFRAPLEKMMALSPEWIAMTSLFFDGEVNAKIEVQDYTRPGKGRRYTEAFYNCYSLPLVRDTLNRGGYGDCVEQPFMIQKDLPKSSSKGMASYTRTTAKGERLLFSGPLWLNWYFILARRSPKTKA